MTRQNLRDCRSSLSELPASPSKTKVPRIPHVIEKATEWKNTRAAVALTSSEMKKEKAVHRIRKDTFDLLLLSSCSVSFMATPCTKKSSVLIRSGPYSDTTPLLRKSSHRAAAASMWQYDTRGESLYHIVQNTLRDVGTGCWIQFKNQGFFESFPTEARGYLQSGG